MFHRIIEIIVFVISELKTNKTLNEINLQELSELGYSSSEISTAFSWLVDRFELEEKFFVKSKSAYNSNSFRILHSAESELFTKEAHGQLIQFRTLGILNNEQIENLIERSIITGVHLIDSAMLKAFVANVVFDAYRASPSSNKLILTGNETIN
jgi:uncharacterized protein Smg (DUF494 family)